MTTNVRIVQGKTGGRARPLDLAAAKELDRLPVPREEDVRRVSRWVTPVLEKYFRSEVRELERLPSTQTILVTHHDGGVLPINGFCVGNAWHQLHGFKRPLYVLTHDIFHGFSQKISSALGSIGMVPADRPTMDAALATGSSVLVFPGAARESFRPFWERDQIDLGGRTGFVAQAIRWDLPITPVVSAGSHETLFVLSRGTTLARKLGIPKLVRSADIWPLLAGFPWGLWALPFVPHFPLPAKITSEVLHPIYLPKVLGRKLRPSDADDRSVVQAGYEVVLRAMRPALRRLYDERRWPVIG